jgi:hypothetical protein
MNSIKADYGFVDLLKPETSASLPILASLAPTAWLRARPAVVAAARAAARRFQYDALGIPADADLVAARRADPSYAPPPEEASHDGAPAPDAEAIEFADACVGEVDAGETSEVAESRLLPKILLKTLRYWANRDRITWNVQFEAST